MKINVIPMDLIVTCLFLCTLTASLFAILIYKMPRKGD